MKHSTQATDHPIRHVRKNGVVVYVTREHAKRLYRRGDMPANYPVPAMIGKVMFDYWPRVGGLLECLDVIVTDCDERADPRLVITVIGRNEVFTDYPHDSPNYR